MNQKIHILMISVLLSLMFQFAKAEVELKYPKVENSGGAQPTTVPTKKGALIVNYPTYIKIYNNDFKKLNSVEYDILAEEQTEYLILMSENMNDSFYANSSWDDILKQTNQNMNRIARVRFTSFEFQAALEMKSKNKELTEKLKEYENVKSQVVSAASISERIQKNENDIIRNRSIMWGAILLILIFLVLFKRRNN